MTTKLNINENLLSKSELEALKLYLADIDKISSLTCNEEKVLAEKAVLDDTEASRTLFESNLHLVVSIAQKYIEQRLTIQDLINEGNMGLLHAIQKFKPAEGLEFSNCATYYIHKAISNTILNHKRTIILPIEEQVEIELERPIAKGTRNCHAKYSELFKI